MGKCSRVRAVKSSALRTIFLLFLLLCAAPFTVSGAQLSDPRVIQFTPQGTVKKVRQVTARFSEPMVPLGDPRLADPFEITCPEPGTARWVDSSNCNPGRCFRIILAPLSNQTARNVVSPNVASLGINTTSSNPPLDRPRVAARLSSRRSPRPALPTGQERRRMPERPPG